MTSTGQTNPYATIIVPIIDRAETLKVGVTSGLAQDRPDIEVLIACSGATPEVLQVAHDFARRDTRVRVLDLPPSPVSTAAARAEALRQARSDRILILQDDDLWFPNHVATMGALLDEADFASTVSMAATVSGSIVAWPCTFGHPGYRSAYTRGASKVLFEAHYAFRRSSYDRLQVDWDQQTSGGCSRRLLDAHVAEAGNVRWAMAAVPTALSLNSPPREWMTIRQRADEMVQWQKRFSAGEDAGAILAHASYAPVLGQLLRIDDPGSYSSPEDYLTRFGIQLAPEDGEYGRASNDGVLSVPVTRRQRQDLTSLFELARGRAVGADRVARMIVDMIEPFSSSEPNLHFVNVVLWAVYRSAAAFDIMMTASRMETDCRRAALAEIALASAFLKIGDTEQAGRHWRRVEDLFPPAAASSPVIAASVALAEGRNEDVVALLAPRVASGHGGPGYYIRLVQAQMALDRKAEASETLNRGLAAFPKAAKLRELARQFHL